MDIPQSPDDLTAEVLTVLLRERGHLPLGSVIELQMRTASSTSGIIGQTVRLQVAYDRPVTAPASFIAKFPVGREDRRAYFSALGMYAREVHFYRHLAVTTPLNVPRAYVTQLDAESQQAFLLLEDLSPAVTGDRVTGCSAQTAALALDTIARLHIAWWNSPQLTQWDWLGSYQHDAFEDQFQRSWTAFLAAGEVTAELMQLGEALSRNLDPLMRLWQPPLTLIHRDYNLDNLLFKRDSADEERLYVIDWQLVRQGRAIFDVATFLCWNLEPGLRREHEQRLLERYYAALLAGGVQDYAWDDCLTDYRLAQLECLTRTIAILGSGMVEEAHLLRLLHTILDRNLAALSDWEVHTLLG